MKKRVLCLFVALVFVLSTFASFAGGATYGNVSDWARPELDKAMANSIVMYESLLSDCKRNITRQEFAGIVMNLYRAIKQEDPAPAPSNTFSDTTDTDVRIAYNLGIINGVGNGLFAPNSPVTREQMGVMMLNAVKKLGVDFSQGDGYLVMTDKGSVSSWAVDGVDFVYENEFMKGDGINFNPKNTTPIEQAVVIVNRVYEKFADVEPIANDYSQGYKTSIENDGLYITYNNSGNKECVVKYGEKYSTTGSTLKTYSVSQVDHSMYYANKYITFLDEDGYLFSYNITKDKFHNYAKKLGKLDAYVIVEQGKYAGYYLLRFKGDDKMYAYDDDLNKVGQIYTMDQYTVEPYIDSAYNFKFIVDGTEYKRYQYYGGNWDYGKTLEMSYNSSSTGPMALVNDAFDNRVLYHSSGIYETTMKFNNEENCNAGIVFNVTRAQVGNDQYTGYYVGINPKNNSVQVGWANNNWNRLKEVELGFDVKSGKEYDLRVEKIGNNIEIYVDGTSYININDATLNVDGYIGLRGWKADVEYISFTAEKVPF